jgi:hypothetical protein
MKKILLLALLAVFTAGPAFSGTINVTQPAGGNVAMGAVVPIAWTAVGVTGDVKIQLIKPGGALVGLLANNIAPSASPWSWTVVAPAVAGETYKVRVRAVDGMAEGVSAEFTVAAGAGVVSLAIQTPNGGENWEYGSIQVISWTGSNIPVNCHLYLLKNNQVLGLISDTGNGPNGGSWNWNVGNYLNGPASFGSGYKVRIETFDGQTSDSSDNPFTISSPPLVFHPVDRLPNLGKITPLPDLIVCLHWHGEIPLIYQHRRVYVRVKNVGLANAPPSIFKVYVEGHGTLNYQSPWLAPNAEYSWSKLYMWKSCGHKTVRVTVDPAGLIAESNESNNMLEGRIEVSCSGMPGYLLEMLNCSDPNQHY